MKESLKKIVFFAGKGGVGKTTCSLAYSLKCSKEDVKTLVTSTDPAHSTSHLLDLDVGDEPTKIRKNLYAKEINPKEEAQKHQKKIMEEIRQLLSPETISSIKKYLKMTHNSPGVIESAILDAIIDTIKEEEYEKIVFDTAPTGQTLRILQLPEILDSWANSLIERRREDIERMKSIDSSEKPGGPLIQKLKERRDKLRYGRNKIINNSSLIPVMTPEKLSLEETKEGIKSFEKAKINVPGIIINKVSQHSEKRKEYEENRIKEIKKEIGKKVLGKIPRRETEVVGLDKLNEITDYIDIN